MVAHRPVLAQLEQMELRSVSAKKGADVGMVWQDYAAEIRDVLELEGNSVAVTYSMKPPSEAAEGKHRVCDACLETCGGRDCDHDGAHLVANSVREVHAGQSALGDPTMDYRRPFDL